MKVGDLVYCVVDGGDGPYVDSVRVAQVSDKRVTLARYFRHGGAGSNLRFTPHEKGPLGQWFHETPEKAIAAFRGEQSAKEASFRRQALRALDNVLWCDEQAAPAAAPAAPVRKVLVYGGRGVAVALRSTSEPGPDTVLWHSGNSFVIVADERGPWLYADHLHRLRVALVSVNGGGEVRWTVERSMIQGNGDGVQHRAAVAHFNLKLAEETP